MDVRVGPQIRLNVDELVSFEVVLEKTFKSPLGSKEIKLVNLKGNHLWILIERTDTEDETPILCPPDAKSQLIGKNTVAGKD